MTWPISFTDNCPQCNGINYLCREDKHGSECQCLDCGYFSKSETGFLTLEQVNELRKANDLESMDKLAS